jgi:flavin reductase (DIM6/NTAB) family NADH-FMN oxidoreductase RutF
MSSERPMVLTQDFDQLEAQADFRHACSRFATGIALLSLLDAEGQPHGMTVNSFTSVSLDPLLFLVCIDYKAGLWPLLKIGSPIAVSILAEDQQQLSVRFARPGFDRFGDVEWSPGQTGAPLLAGSIAAIEGIVSELIPAGDHSIVLASVSATRYSDGRPLLYFSSRYAHLGGPHTV